MDHALPAVQPLDPVRRVRVWVVYAMAVAGLATCITAMWTGMREVMAVGGACAEGVPYQVATPCPEGVELLLVPAMPLGFVLAFVVAAIGSKLGRGAGGVAFLAWPALFLSLGWNFLEFGLHPAGGGGADAGLLVCAAVFALMGGAPLALLPGAVKALEHRAAVVVVVLGAAAGGVLGGLAFAAAVTGG